MPTANERKALWFLALVALSGTGVRLMRATASGATAAESGGLERQITRVDSVRATRRLPKLAPSPQPIPLNAEPRSQVDLDRATADEIESLPGIGPALAQRIVGNRDSVGTFGRIEGLCAVRGVGPSLVEKLRPLVTFSGARRPLSDECGSASNKPAKTSASRSRQRR